MVSTTVTERSRAGAGVDVRRVATIDELRGVWDPLAEAAGHPFGSWEWISAWWDTYGAGKELFLHACDDPDGRLAAILPLYSARRGPVRVGRFIGYADLHSPLCHERDRPLAAAALRELLGRGDDRCTVLLLEKMPGEQHWGDVVGGSVVKVDADPVLQLGGRTWEEYEASMTSKLRKRTRYQERRLARDHAVSFDLCTDPAQLDGAMSELFALHDARFGDVSTGIFRGERAELQRRFAAAAFGRGWLRLWILRVDGRPAAAYHGIRYAGSEFFFQSGRDPEFDRLSVGSVLLMHVIRDACEAGIRDFRFLAGDESYKTRLADSDWRPETRLLAGSRALERAGGAIARRVWKLPPERRAKLMRGFG